MALYVSITNGRGKLPVKVQLVDANEERDPIWSIEQEADFPDPRIVMEMYFQMPEITFPEPGEYRFQLFASNEFLMERRIIINPIGAE